MAFPNSFLKCKLQDSIVASIKRVESGVMSFEMTAQKIDLMVKEDVDDRMAALEVMKPFDDLFGYFEFKWFNRGLPTEMVNANLPR